jgi:hypothetical protein
MTYLDLSLSGFLDQKCCSLTVKCCVKVIGAFEVVTAVPSIDTVVETGCSTVF